MTKEMSKMDMLDQWLKNLVRRSRVELFIKVTCEEGEGGEKGYSIRKRIHFYTNDYVYSITAHDRSKDEGYLGCTASTRKPRAGEDWTRGNDLADGKFNEETWHKILADIIWYEIVELAPRVHHMGDEKSPPVGPSLGETDESDVPTSDQQPIAQPDVKGDEGNVTA